MRLLSLTPLALLAACGQPAPAPAPTATATANAYAAKVAALAPAQRAGVMMRAIRDADQGCQKVEAVAPAAASAWVATCDDQRQWVVVIAADGTATVIDAKDAARHQ